MPWVKLPRKVAASVAERPVVFGDDPPVVHDQEAGALLSLHIADHVLERRGVPAGGGGIDIDRIGGALVWLLTGRRRAALSASRAARARRLDMVQSFLSPAGEAIR